MIIDLHAHTYLSDGSLAPAELVTLAEKQGVEVFSITDHDTMAAYDHLDPDATDIRLIPGVEISCQQDGSELHLVALNVTPDNQALQQLLEDNQRRRLARSDWIKERLVKLGYVDLSQILDEIVRGQVICRTHLAQALIKAGIVDDFGQAFKRYLGRNGKVWRRPEWSPVAEVVEVVHQAGGLAILAHPTKYRFSSGRMSRLIEAFAQAGGDGLEVNYSGLNLNHKSWLKRLAQLHNLKASVGCDFHHPGQTWAKPGSFSRLDPELTPIWQELPL